MTQGNDMTQREIAHLFDAEERPLVLVAEDGDNEYRATERVLSALGYDVARARDGQEAVEFMRLSCAEGTPPAAILMDYHMTRVNGNTVRDGLHATELIRGISKTPIIFYSGQASGMPGCRLTEQAFAAGCDAVICKPANLQTIENTLGEQVRRGYEQSACRD